MEAFCFFWGLSHKIIISFCGRPHINSGGGGRDIQNNVRSIRVTRDEISSGYNLRNAYCILHIAYCILHTAYCKCEYCCLEERKKTIYVAKTIKDMNGYYISAKYGTWAIFAPPHKKKLLVFFSLDNNHNRYFTPYFYFR